MQTNAVVVEPMASCSRMQLSKNFLRKRESLRASKPPLKKKRRSSQKKKDEEIAMGIQRAKQNFRARLPSNH